MTASAQIVGTVRGVPDSASISFPNSGASKSNFRSVLEQYHTSRESASETDDTQRKQQDSDPTTLAASQPVTPAVEAPRLILPFTTSITLRQDATSSSDDTATQDSTEAADPNAVPSVNAHTLPTPVIVRSTLDLRSLPLVSDTKTNSTPGGAQTKARAKLQARSKDSAPSPTGAAPLAQTEPADPSTPLLSVTSSDTFEQAAPVVQNSSTVRVAPDTVSTSTSDRGIAYQYRSPNGRPAETAVGKRASQELQNVSNPSQAVTAPIPITNAVEPQPLLHLPTGTNTPRQDANAIDSGSSVPQDSSSARETDTRAVTPPALERADDPTAGPNAGALAFAARLTPSADGQPSAPEPTGPAETPSRSSTQLQLVTPVTAKQIAIGADLAADSQSGEGGGQPDKEKATDRFAKPDMLLPQMHATIADQTAIPANNHASTSPLSPIAHLGQVADPPAAALKTNNDITVRIPDSTDQGTAVRFVERAGEIHVSVRTGDAEMAQSLRGGLNDLVNHLEDGGIRTEVWQPGSGSNAASSQNDSHHPFADPDGSQGRQYPSGSNAEQESRQHNKPRWVEELEGSIGNAKFKETTQLLWQA